ncbi:hypothetical protein [Streptomyces sp. NPDC057557]|uniref:hypothetical protein n=1 Tax=Streptomyces sp. NPDC057557 TaxID=3346167 RepID=UPI0036A2B2D1
MPAGTACPPRPGATVPRTRAGKRQGLSGHDDHLCGPTRRLLGAAHTIGTPGTAGSGRCTHRGGTGDARPPRGAERLVLAAAPYHDVLARQVAREGMQRRALDRALVVISVGPDVGEPTLSR